MFVTTEILEAIEDRFEAWELADFLQIPIHDFVTACFDFDWINEENWDDLLDFADLRTEDEDDG